MGMLFGGWYKETEEEVNDLFGGDWNAYRRHMEMNKINLVHEPMEFSSSFPKVTVGDMICQWDSSENKPLNEFLIQRIIDGKIYGRYIDGRHDGSTELYKQKEYRKLFSVSQKV